MSSQEHRPVVSHYNAHVYVPVSEIHFYYMKFNVNAIALRHTYLAIQYNGTLIEFIIGPFYICIGQG